MPWAKLPRWIVLEGMIATLTPAETKTLMIIITLTDQQGFTNPSNKLLAQAAGITDRSVRDAIKGLNSKKCIEIIEPASGRKSAMYRIDPARRPEHSFLSTKPVDRNATSGQARPERSFRPQLSGLQPVDRNAASGLHTHIGTRAEKKEEREINYSLTLPDYAVDCFYDTFPPGLIKTNWSNGNFKALRDQLANQPMTTEWQVRRCLNTLLSVPNRKFQVPNPAEVYEAFKKIESGNRARSKFFERGVKNDLRTENLGSYISIIESLNSDQIKNLFETTRTRAMKIAPQAAALIWDATVPALQRNAYTDILIDPECNQYASRGLRNWVITTHRIMQEGGE